MTEAVEVKEKAPTLKGAEARENSDTLAILTTSASAANRRIDPIDAAAPMKIGGIMLDPATGARKFSTPSGRDYYMMAEGVEYEEAGSKARVKMCGPLEAVAEIRTAEGTDRRKLVRWTDDEGGEHERQFALSDFLNPKAVCAKLMQEGLRIDGRITSQGGVAVAIADYLKSFPAPERYRGVPRLGWYGPAGSVFVLPENKIVESSRVNEVLVYTGPEEGAPAFSSSGTLDEWKERIAAPTLYSSRAAFAVCVAFAAPLLAFTAEDSGGFHFYGQSSRGKSTALRAACCVWAPADPAGEMGSWRATDNGLEALFAAHTDLPVVLDEIGQAKSAAVMIELSYMLGNGSGKRRMSKNLQARQSVSWCSLFLSSGELTIREAAERERRQVEAGVLVRMAHIPAMPSGGNEASGIFDLLPVGESAAEVADALNEAAKQLTFGTAGPAFLKAVVEEISREGRDAFSQFLKKRMREWTERHAQTKDGQIERVAKRFALVAVAGELAIKYGILPWSSGAASQCAAECFDAWRDAFMTPEQEEEMLVTYLFEQVIALEDRFDRLSPIIKEPEQKRSSMKRIGYLITQGGDFADVYVIPSEFPELCKDRRKKPTLDALSRRGFLREHAGGRHIYKARRMPDDRVPLTSAYIVLIGKMREQKEGDGHEVGS